MNYARKHEGAPMSNGRHVLPGVDLTQTVTIGQLIGIARAFGPEGDGHATGADPDHNAEYTRGQAELICDAAGLTSDDKDTVITAITKKAS